MLNLRLSKVSWSWKNVILDPNWRLTDENRFIMFTFILKRKILNNRTPFDNFSHYIRALHRHHLTSEEEMHSFKVT